MSTATVVDKVEIEEHVSDDAGHLDWDLEGELTLADYRKARELDTDEAWRELTGRRAINMASGILENPPEGLELIKQVLFENHWHLRNGEVYAGDTRLRDTFDKIDVEQAKEKTDGRFQEIEANLRQQLLQVLDAIEAAARDGDVGAAIVTSPQMSRNGHHVVQIFVPDPQNAGGVLSFYGEFRGSDRALSQFVQELEAKLTEGGADVLQQASRSQAGVYGAPLRAIEHADILDAARKSIAGDLAELREQQASRKVLSRIQELELYLERFSAEVADPAAMRERQARLEKYLELQLAKLFIANMQGEQQGSDQFSQDLRQEAERLVELGALSLPKLAEQFLHQSTTQQQSELRAMESEVEHMQRELRELVELRSTALDSQSMQTQFVGAREQILSGERLTPVDRAVTVLLDRITDSRSDEQRVDAFMKLEKLINSALVSMDTDPTVARVYAGLKQSVADEIERAQATKRILGEVFGTVTHYDDVVAVGGAHKRREEEERRSLRLVGGGANEVASERIDAERASRISHVFTEPEVPLIFRRAGLFPRNRGSESDIDRAAQGVIDKLLGDKKERARFEEMVLEQGQVTARPTVRPTVQRAQIEPEEPLPQRSDQSANPQTVAHGTATQEAKLVELAKKRELTELYKFIERVALPVVQVRKLLKQSGLDDALVEMIMHIYQSRITELREPRSVA